MDILCRYIVIINILLRIYQHTIVYDTYISAHNRLRSEAHQYFSRLPVRLIANTGAPFWFNIEHNDISRYYIVIINILLSISAKISDTFQIDSM